jgi:NADP-dependent 3-hydroxy acid dehydrogenase YdfG
VQGAIVTGASSGIGEGIARALIDDGFGVALAARRSKNLGALAAELGAHALAVPTDVTSSAEVNELVGAAKRQFGGLMLVVTCAGVYVQKPIEKTDERDWDQVLGVNLKGSYLVARAALPHLRESRGYLIGISSLSGTIGEADLSAYAASKWGVRGLLATIVKEAERDGVRATAICPASTATAMTENKDAAPELITIHDIVETVRWLLRLRPTVKVREVVLDLLDTT